MDGTNLQGCSLGWPTADLWSNKLHTLTKMLKKEQEKQVAEENKKTEKELTAKQKKEALEEQKQKKQGVLEKVKDQVEAAAKDSMNHVPKGKPCLENLSKEAQVEIAVISGSKGLGSCARCRWSIGGCLSCSVDKALQYHLKKEGLLSKH